MPVKVDDDVYVGFFTLFYSKSNIFVSMWSVEIL